MDAQIRAALAAIPSRFEPLRLTVGNQAIDIVRLRFGCRRQQAPRPVMHQLDGCFGVSAAIQTDAAPTLPPHPGRPRSLKTFRERDRWTIMLELAGDLDRKDDRPRPMEALGDHLLVIRLLVGSLPE